MPIHRIDRMQPGVPVNSIHPSLVFSRSTVGTRFSAAGVESTAAIGAERDAYIDGVYKGLMLEPDRTFYSIRTTDFANAAWLTTGAGLSKVGTATLNGESCYRVNLGTNDNATFDSAGAIYQSIASTGVAGSYWVNVRWAGGAANQSARVGGILGLVTANSGTVNLPSDRFIVTRVKLSNVLASNGGNISIRPANGFQNNEVLIHSMWLSQGEYGDSHYPLTTVTGTRAGDAIQVSPFSFLSDILPAAYLLRYNLYQNAPAVRVYDDNVYPAQIDIDPIGLNRRCVVVYFDPGTGLVSVTNDGVDTVFVDYTLGDVTLFFGSTGSGELGSLNANLEAIEWWQGPITAAQRLAAQRRATFLGDAMFNSPFRSPFSANFSPTFYR